MNERRISFIYRSLVIVNLLSGIILNLINTTSIQVLLSYYTMQSNIFCLFAFIFFQIADRKKYTYRESDLYYLVKGAVTIAILVAAFIYTITLLPNGFPMYVVSQNDGMSKQMGNLLVHFLSPVSVVVDYFWFDKKGNFKLFYPVIWLWIPIQYVCFVYLYRARGGYFYYIGGSRQFAYFFLDYYKIGIQGVAIWMSGIASSIILLGYIWVYVDRKFAKRKKNP